MSPRKTAAQIADQRQVVEPPPSQVGEARGVFSTQLEKMVAWARSGSLWPLPFGTACCAIEFMSVVSSHYDLARFGAEVVRFSPRQSDMMIVAGTVVDKQAPILKLIYEQMCEPKWVISMGVCASSGGFYRAYHVMQGIDEVVPVDVYVPGCPPTPEGLIYAILKLQEKIERGEPSRYQRILLEERAAEPERHVLAET
jgi:NADH-quinone oxidoreductase subunit B